MEINKAHNLGISLMEKHGLLDKGWYFQFDRSVKRFGVCSYRRKCISISKPLVELNDENKVKDTILHEIAHALVGNQHGHDRVWKEMCMKIGAKPERCYSTEEILTPKLKYYAKCSVCGKEFQVSRLVKKNVRRSCSCQRGKDWNDRVLVEFKKQF